MTLDKNAEFVKYADFTRSSVSINPPLDCRLLGLIGAAGGGTPVCEFVKVDVAKGSGFRVLYATIGNTG